MTDEQDKDADSSAAEATGSTRSDEHGGAEADNIQSLTDFFDQMDRAAFKRALANRDSLREARWAAKSQRR